MKTGSMIPLFAIAIAAQAIAQEGPLRIEARPIPRREAPMLDRMVPDPDGELGPAGRAAVVVVRLDDPECPVGQRYRPVVARLEEDYGRRGVAFVAVAPEGRLARTLRARTTTETFVLDGRRTLRYRGAIDDRFGVGFSKDAASRNFLADALDDVLAGRAVAVAATGAPGCLLDLEAPAPDAGEATYHRDVARIVQAGCQPCHRQGGSAPFPLETYEQVHRKRAMIDFALAEDLMPPWFAEGGLPFVNDRSLPAEEKALLRRWIAAGAPEGDAGEGPLPIEWPDEWRIGRPDLVLELPEAIEVPAEGDVRYQYAYVQVPLDEERWIEAVEIRPTAPEVVHHILVFLEEPRRPGETRREWRRRFRGGLFGFFAGLVPGQTWASYPDGFAKRLPAGAWLKFQIHYTTNGQATSDRTRIAFRFADGPPEYEVQTSAIADTGFEIPPGAANHLVEAEMKVPIDGGTILAFMPHMHLRGKAFRYEMVEPDGSTVLLLDIPRFDFNWQLRYELARPIAVPKGAVLKARAWFDNGTDNPANPDPSATVRFGEQTWEEMMIGYFEWYRKR